MALSSFVFYSGNVLLLAVYLVLAALSRKPGGITGKSDADEVDRRLAVTFFLLAALLHADMAWHVITLIPFFLPPRGGPIAWDFALIVLAKFIVVAAAISRIFVKARRERPRRRRSRR